MRSLSIISFLPINEETPIISKIFAILEPTALAATISVAPWPRAKRDETNSGRDVPAAIMVTPTIKGESPAASPIRSALERNQSAPFTMATSDTKKIIIQSAVMGIL